MDMLLQERLLQEIKGAMKEGNKEKVTVIRMLRADIKNKEIKRGKDYRLSEYEVLEVIASSIKKRRDAIEQFSKGGRDDLVEKEKREIDILETFLPRKLKPEEIDLKIREIIEKVGANSVKDIGRVMKVIMPDLIGQAEGSYVSKRVKELLTV